MKDIIGIIVMFITIPIWLTIFLVLFGIAVGKELAELYTKD